MPRGLDPKYEVIDPAKRYDIHLRGGVVCRNVRFRGKKSRLHPVHRFLNGGSHIAGLDLSGEPYIDVEQEDGTLMKITWKAFLGVCEHGSETLIGMPD